MATERTRVGILISGRGSNMAALIAAARAADCPYEIVLVASNKPAAAGLATAQAEGIATFALSHAGMTRETFDRQIDAALRAAGCEVIALAGYMRLLSDAFVAGWEGRMLNIHPSLLPKYKGLHTHARALAAGDAAAGCSVHIVTPELDGGPVIARAEVPVLADDTVETLEARVLQAEHALYPQALAEFVRGRS
jgi:phosphoribosylglycinamide formyltransferase 1